MLFWLLCPTCSVCTWTAKCFLGNVGSRAKPGTDPAAGHGTMEEQCCICLVGILLSWRKLDSIPIPTSLPGNSWASSKQIFCWVWEVNVCHFIVLSLGFECPSLFMAPEVTSWLSQRQWMTTASFLHPTCHPTLMSGNLCRKINAEHFERLFWACQPFLMPITCCSLTSLLQTQHLNF